MENKQRLIDADAPMKNIGKIPKLRGITYSRMKKAVEEAPTIDAVPVVRCKDCWKRGNYECPMCYDTFVEYEDGGTNYVFVDSTKEDGYCNKGERRCEA